MLKKLLCVLLFLPFSYMLHGQCMTQPETLENLVAASPLVVEGKVRSQQGFWDADNKNIYTVNEIEIFNAFKGITTVSTIQVVTLGGVVALDTEEPAMDRVSSALELQVDEMGLFMLQAFPGNLSNNFANTTPLYRPTEGVLGFIRYDLIIGEAKGVYAETNSTVSELYNTITALTDAPVNLGLWDAQDTELTGMSSVERSIVSEEEGSSNATFEVHAGVGDILTLTGGEFGTETGRVLFPDANSGGNQYIAALPHQILEWSDTRIILEVPYRAGTGKVRIDKANGESLIGAEDLPLGYDHINVQYTDGNGRKSYETQLTSDNGAGGYDFQFESDFAQNPGASEAFVSLIETWACATGVNFQIGAVTNVDEDANDGINIVRFDNGDELGGRTLAYARSRYRGCYQGETIKWYVNEIEVVVNDDYDWYYGDGQPGRGQFDFETVMLHEIGHTQQLGHVINANEVMHFAVGPGQQKRSLSHIDTIGGEFVTTKSTDEAVCGRALMEHYGSCCETMVITGQPTDQTLCQDDTTASFGFDVDFSEVWQWQRKDGELWVNLVDSDSYSGTDTAMLSVNRVNDTIGEFRCIASNACDESVTSETGRLSVRNLDFSLITLPATCEFEGQIQLNRENTEGSFIVSIDGGNNFDVEWPANENEITITVASGTYAVRVADTGSDCAVDLGEVTIQDSVALELSADLVQNADCSNKNGNISVTFNDHPEYTSVALSLDGGVTFENFDDTLGTVIFENLTTGAYEVMGMWEDGSCQTVTNVVVIGSVQNCPEETNEDTDSPNMPDDTDRSDPPEGPDTTEMPGNPETPDASENTDTPDTTEMPEETMDTNTPETEDADEPADFSIRLYPNPTTERIYVKTGQGEIIRFQLFSSRGTLVQDFVPQQETRGTYFMDTDRLQAGVYSLYIITGKTNVLRQLVVK